jgi:alpha-beta hydrolase superfamily lysophospholipase
MGGICGKPVLLLAAAMAFTASTARAQSAGTLIAADPVATAPAGMKAWRIRYWTRDEKDLPLAVTGMVVAPAAPAPAAPARPVIAWTHGLVGIARRCAPSLGDDNFTVIPGLKDALARGYTVVAPDYPGLGSEGVHPVLIGVSEGRSTLDAVRAARRIPAAASGTRFALWGESQGGHAALWSGQIQARYAPELQLAGIVAVVPPTDLARNLTEGSDPRVRALLIAYTATSWSRLYGAPMATFGSASVQRLMMRLADNNCVRFDARPKLGTIVGIAIAQRAIARLDLSRQQPWGRMMRANSPSAAAIPVPALIATGTADTIVAPAVVRDFARLACRRDRTVRFMSIQGGRHETVARSDAAAMLDWIDARFAGRKAPGNCGTF